MRVVIAEDSVLLRAGVQRLLTDEGIETAAAVHNNSDALLGAVPTATIDAVVPASCSPLGGPTVIRADLPCVW
jgi:DNA-binding NarL/FixJ family response regulator